VDDTPRPVVTPECIDVIEAFMCDINHIKLKEMTMEIMWTVV